VLFHHFTLSFIIITSFRVGHHGLFRFRILTSDIYDSIWTFGRIPWTGDRPIARPLPTQDNTTQKNADTHPSLERDSNSRSQCSSDRRQYVPQTARPLGPAVFEFYFIYCWVKWTVIFFKKNSQFEKYVHDRN
jgi:hypothetical protein